MSKEYPKFPETSFFVQTMLNLRSVYSKSFRGKAN